VNAVDAIIKKFQSRYNLNDQQIEAITSTGGPVQVIAGPGSGKTLVLILRALYLLMSKRASPSEIILTTFTEKATFELRDRISLMAQEVGYTASLHDLRIGTMHGICTDIINVHLNQTPLHKNYVVLDDMTQQLFLFENFFPIFHKKDQYLGKWEQKAKWNIIREALLYFDKITEETVRVNELKGSGNELLVELAKYYERYEQRMFATNHVDFAHLQKIVFDLLKDEDIYKRIKGEVKYIMIDEYQDTNYIQEQIFLRLAAPDNNICIVGDDDQALYRFRGGTVRNILEFDHNFTQYAQGCKPITLSTNYRSHAKIIDAYNQYMRSIAWNYDGRSFRFNKKIVPNPDQTFADYPAVFRLPASRLDQEGEAFARAVEYFKQNGIINDYSDVALLLRSVQKSWSGHYIDALIRHGIPYFNPRARHYLQNDEVKFMLSCYADIFELAENEALTQIVRRYVREGRMLRDQYDNLQLRAHIENKAREIRSLEPSSRPLDTMMIDYLYELLAYEPFSLLLQDEHTARNLGILTNLIDTFQMYYNKTVVTYDNREWMKRHLFSSYFNFLIQLGVNEYEDPDNPFPRGRVQIMTVHQAKGLEFPVVVVGSLNKKGRVDGHEVDANLGPFYPREEFEPPERISEFDAMRLFYVAFSRAERFLGLSARGEPVPQFTSLWETLPAWSEIHADTLKSGEFTPKPQYVPKKAYSLVSHINVYETCPQQYLMYKEYGFAPARFGGVLFGTLVHQTIEDVHRKALEGKLAEITREDVEVWLNRNYQSLLANGYRPIGQTQQRSAFNQVLNYLDQNREDIQRIIDVELDVSVEKADYIMIGKIDILMGEDGKLEALDFKTQQKPPMDDELMQRYEKQLHVYGHILQERYHKTPERLLIYWTSEPKKEDAITEISYSAAKLQSVGEYFDDVVARIRGKEFDVKKEPDKKVCKECDFRFYCSQNKIVANVGF
jgi:DNA helicase-2/ATP-dependent DNA helicase PcrA